MSIVRRFKRVGRAFDPQAQMVALVKDTLHGFDADHVAYLVRRQVPLWDLIPQPLYSAAMGWLVPQARVMATVTHEEMVAACREARPDCAEVFGSPEAQKWLAGIFGDVPFFVKLLV